jgi:hypothetical protein
MILKSEKRTVSVQENLRNMPECALGSKQVDLGGITKPRSAILIKSLIEVG